MLGEYDVTPVLAVKDLAAAEDFYGGVLGLQVAEETDFAVHYQVGNGVIEVYPSDYAGSNQATAATWKVTNIESLVADLKGRGVAFEHYDLPGTTLEGDIHTMGDGEMKAVWFKDPDGNILCLHEE